MKRTSFLMACVLVAGCAQMPRQAETAAPAPNPSAVPVPAAAVDPVGVYDFTTAVNGEEVSAAMYITGSAGAYTGRITTAGQPDIDITSVTVAGNTMIVLGGNSDARLTSTWVLEGDVLSGTWSFADLSGEARGKKRTS